MNMPVESITLECDNPRHTRGRTAKIETWDRTAAGWELRDRRPPPRRTTRGASNRKKDKLSRITMAMATGDGELLGDAMTTAATSCKLCGAHLPPPDVSDGELNWIARHHGPVITLRQLRALRSQSKR